jgi:subtilisin family serine protease
MQKYAALGTVLLAVAACQDATSPRPIAGVPTRVNAAQGNAVNDYIVVFKDTETDPDGAADALVKAHGGSLRYVYRTAIKGFAVANLPDAALEALQRNPRVAYVEADGIMTADDTQTPAPSWGLDRIDAITGTNGSYTYPNTGGGVTAYILDTGINPTHDDFTGRILQGRDFIDGDNVPTDCHGHGTHVSGTVGGTTYGVAKAVKLVAVRVLNCAGSGSTSGVIAGVDWVTANAIKPAVANMSLGGGAWAALDDAVTGAIASGVTFAVAAGNSNADACNYSPSATPNAITVGSTTIADMKSSFSNYGPCVDVNAPGSSITSAWIGSNSATNTISGTSMASPHVAGAAALVLGNNSALTPAQVRDALVNGATNNVIGGLGNGTPNKLLYVGFIGGGTPPVDPPPPPPPSLVAQFTKSCSGLTCTFTSTSSGPIASTSWNFGDGATGSGNQISHTFAARQNYTVRITITSTATPPATATATQQVTCNPKKCL